MNLVPAHNTALVADLRALIDGAFQRASYGDEIVSTLRRQLIWIYFMVIEKAHHRLLQDKGES